MINLDQVSDDDGRLFPLAAAVFQHLDYNNPRSPERIAEKAGNIHSPLQVLSALPFMWVSPDKQEPHKGAAFGLVALDALQRNRAAWEPILQRYKGPHSEEA